MNPMHEKEPQATVERDPEPGIDRHKDPPQADSADTKGLVKEWMAHMRELNHHYMAAYFTMVQILANVTGLSDDE